ncbi:RNA demethylase ALKBH9B [Dendrobium catenatum]|uniref:ALKBH5 n=1 Tax=Dendrobium catenatum TaxID=906689 RepID=A0A2I0XJJ9_9ASPA|nr:RNA demethylase ALKBH9B [Dendrobium catenatum]PKU88093.1 ALKBH5 [Dendrobium catenatum]
MAAGRSVNKISEELKSLSLRGSAGGSGRGGGILLDEDDEAVRFANVRKNDFKHWERVRGRLINILDGLELHTSVFSSAEQRRIVDCVYDFQEKGRKGRLRERTYSEPRKWMRGKGRVTIQFGCCYNYAMDSNGNPPGIIRDEEVDPIPPLLKQMIKRMVAWHVLPPSCIPNSCIVNIYDKDDCIPPHIDHHDFVRPFCTVSFLSECNIVFGTELKINGPGDFSGSASIPLPLGSVLVLNGNGADVVKHCVPAVPSRRISITFRKMDDSKIPYDFIHDPDLQNLHPLSLRGQQQTNILPLRQDQPPKNAQPSQKVEQAQKAQQAQKVLQSPAPHRPMQLTEADFPPLSSSIRVQTYRK